MARRTLLQLILFFSDMYLIILIVCLWSLSILDEFVVLFIKSIASPDLD
jgi:hypothetical protein